MRFGWSSGHVGRVPFMPPAPLHPVLPAYPALPGRPVTPGTFPGSGAPGVAANSPLVGLTAYGVPVGYAPSGTPRLVTGQPDQWQSPPDLPGMPQMPGPPDWIFTGQMPSLTPDQPVES